MGSVQNADEYWTLGLQFLDSGNYISVNRDLVRVLGLNEAVIIGELASEAMLYSKEGKLDNGWFYITTEKLEYKTSLSAHLQRKAMNNLKDRGIIEIAYKGIPKKRFVRINFQQLMNFVNVNTSKNLTTVDGQNLQLDVDDFNDINNQHESTNQEQPSKKRAKPSSNGFIPPTRDEVREYVKEKGFRFDPDHFYDFYEAGNWTLNSGIKVKSWKRCCVTWERNHDAFDNNRHKNSGQTSELFAKYDEVSESRKFTL